MSFSVNTNQFGDSRIDEISRHQTRSMTQTGLLGVMQDRVYISSYRSRALKLDPPRNRGRAYVSYNQAYKNADQKIASLRHLRVSQSSCFLLRCVRTFCERISRTAQVPDTRNLLLQCLGEFAPVTARCSEGLE